MQEIEWKIVDQTEFPPQRRRGKYQKLMEAATGLPRGKVVKVEASKVKIGSLRSLLQKEKGKYRIAERNGYVYIRKKD